MHGRRISLVIRSLLAAVLVAVVCQPGVSTSVRAQETAAPTHLLVAWSPSGMPARAERALDAIDGVRATTVLTSIGWLHSSTTRSGQSVDSPAGDYAIPMETAFVKPWEYKLFVDSGDRTTVADLDAREALMPPPAVALRGGHSELEMRLSGERVLTDGPVSTQTSLGYELLMRLPVPAGFHRPVRFLLIRKGDDVSQRPIRRKLERLIDGPYRLASERRVPFLRYADDVHPQFVYKRRFGEFSALPSREGAIAIRESWVDRHIVTGSVPILGSARCHRELFEQLRGALREIRRRGLAEEIRRDEYAGCFNSRYVATAPGSRISRHSWGIAVDVNARSNPFGAKPNQDPRVVSIFEDWGFLWGGRWPLPDGMHFEWRRAL